MPSDIEPMVATAGVPRSIAGWAAEPKLDGWRARVLVGEDGIRVHTRRGHDITASLPALEKLRDTQMEIVLDGEVVAGWAALVVRR